MVRRSILTALVLGVGIISVLVATAMQRERRFQSLVARGTDALGRHDPGAAIEALSGAIALKQDSMVAYLRRGEAYLLRAPNDVRSALRDFREAARLDPTAVRPLERLGDINTKLARYERAAEYYKTGLGLDVGAPRVMYKLALVKYQAGQTHEALTLVQQALALDARLAEAHYLRGLCLVAQKKRREAVAAFRRALALNARLVDARTQLALTARRLGRVREEVAQLEQLAEETQRSEISAALGRALTRMGRVDEAIQVLDDASARFPDSTELMAALGGAWLAKAEVTGEAAARTLALRWLGRAEHQERRVGRPTSDTLAALGRAWLVEGNARAAVDVLQQAVATPPVRATAFDDLGGAAERLGQWSLARTALERAHALDLTRRPDACAARAARLGEVCHRLEDHESAAAWFDEASRLRPEDSSLVVRVVEAHWTAGHRDEAVRALYAALAKQPQDAALRRLAARLGKG
ncbi:MAG: tetratricopeptide repeat protein [Luteitalea sp.]|nr:tetratricopeptide repeat protein [Luteitalea sp.]